LAEAEQANEVALIMPANHIDLDETRDPIVSMPRPRWRTLTTTGFRLSFALMFSYVGAVLLYRLLTHDRFTEHQRLFFAVLAGLCFVGALINLLILRLAWRRPFAILKDGIELYGRTLLWEKVASCRWGRYTPGVLIISTQPDQTRVSLSVSIPERQRTRVEAALRRPGKWDDAREGAENRSTQPASYPLPRT
jgi:hypothetical protein